MRRRKRRPGEVWCTPHRSRYAAAPPGSAAQKEPRASRWGRMAAAHTPAGAGERKAAARSPVPTSKPPAPAPGVSTHGQLGVRKGAQPQGSTGTSASHVMTVQRRALGERRRAGRPWAAPLTRRRRGRSQGDSASPPHAPGQAEERGRQPPHLISAPSILREPPHHKLRTSGHCR